MQEAVGVVNSIVSLCVQDFIGQQASGLLAFTISLTRLSEFTMILLEKAKKKPLCLDEVTTNLLAKWGGTEMIVYVQWYGNSIDKNETLKKATK
ncbi:hypothetical protein HK100_006897, partial [Physocladia obscura]